MKYDKILLVGALLFFTGEAFAIKAKLISCKSLRHSKLVDVDEENEQHYILIRGKKHVEYFGDKQYVRSSLKWTSSCSYKLTVKESTVADERFKPGTVMYVTFDEYKHGTWHGRARMGEESVPVEYKNLEEKTQ